MDPIDFSSAFNTFSPWICGLVIGIVLPLIGVFIVVRRASMLSETVSHGSLAGVGIGLFLGLPLTPVLLFTSMVIAGGIEFLILKKRLFAESVHALFLSGGLATALIFSHFSGEPHEHLEEYLFGDIMQTAGGDAVWLFIAGISTIFLILAFWWKFLILSLDDEFAAASGLNITVYGLFFSAIAATMIAFTVPVTGGLLTGGLIVIPVLSAMLLSSSFVQTALYASMIGLFSVVVGLFSVYFFNTPAAAAIVLVNIILFFIAQLVASRKR